MYCGWTSPKVVGIKVKGLILHNKENLEYNKKYGTQKRIQTIWRTIWQAYQSEVK